MDLYKKKYVKYKAKYLNLKGGGEIVRFDNNGNIFRGLDNRKNNKDTDGKSLLLNHHKNPKTEIWSNVKFVDRWTTCLNLVWRGREQHIYGTCLPNQFNNIYKAGYNNPNGAPPNSEMYNVLGYFMYGLGVSHFVSLHACTLPITWEVARNHYKPWGCAGKPVGTARQKNRASSELNTWNKLKSIYQNDNPNVRFHDILIKDMTVGSIYNWITINNLPFGDSKNTSQAFHCLAGMGRTGSVLLLKLMKYFITGHNGKSDCNMFNPYPYFLHKKFFNVGNSRDFFKFLYMLMADNLYIYSPDDSNESLYRRIYENGYNKMDTVNEVFDLRTHRNIVLFLGRINTILICLWFHLFLNDGQGSVPIIQRPRSWTYCLLFKIPTLDEYNAININESNIFNNGEFVNMANLFTDDNDNSPFYQGNRPELTDELTDLVLEESNYPREEWVVRYGIRFGHDIPNLNI